MPPLSSLISLHVAFYVIGFNAAILKAENKSQETCVVYWKAL